MLCTVGTRRKSAGVEGGARGTDPLDRLGGGTNVLVSDRGVKGLLLRLKAKNAEISRGDNVKGPGRDAHRGAGNQAVEWGLRASNGLRDTRDGGWRAGMNAARTAGISRTSSSRCVWSCRTGRW